MYLIANIIGLAVVLVLAGYLYFKHRQRAPQRFVRKDPADWTGQAIDVTGLKPKLEEVRRNHLAARPEVKGVCFHRGLLGLARRAIVRFGYFHSRENQISRIDQKGAETQL